MLKRKVFYLCLLSPNKNGLLNMPNLMDFECEEVVDPETGELDWDGFLHV
jgi:hypothetical protein